jgi:hypothetical protein
VARLRRIERDLSEPAGGVREPNAAGVPLSYDLDHPCLERANSLPGRARLGERSAEGPDECSVDAVWRNPLGGAGL